MKLASAAAGATLASRNMRAFSSQGSVSLAVVPPLSVFNYSQVQLLDSLFRQQFDNNHNLYLHLDEDALLKPFRHRMSMPAPGPDMGGWYDDANDFSAPDNFHAFIPGHSFGQCLSGLARAYAITGDKATQEKVHRPVRGFAQTVDTEGKFYVDYRLPAYTYDKTSCGLIDAHEFAGDPDALDVHWRATAAAMRHLPENLFLAYQRSGNSRYRDLAIRFIESDYFDPLAHGQNVLSGEHAYSHVNAFSSAMQSYLVLGDEKYLRASQNGLRMVQEQSYATGGWGPDEAFVVPGSGGLN